MRTAVVYLTLLVVAASAYGEKESFFSDKPLPDYYFRKNVFECVSRFYKPQWEEYNKTGLLGIAKITPAVFNGFRAYNGEYQHMAAIGWKSENEIKYFCGGSIILPKYILTAAHCSVSIGNAQPVTVRVGDTDLGGLQNDQVAQQIAIRNIQRHPLHRHSRSYHDIALIELEQPIVYNQYVGPACLWLEDYIPTEPLRIVGFGEVDLGSGPSLTLQQGRVSLISHDSCGEEFLGNRRVSDGLLDGQFCASHESMDACQGDSGGPIEVRRADMFDRECSLIVGITSFGTPCSNGSTGVYTKISNYIDWIESETKETFGYRECLSRSPFAGQSYDNVSPLPNSKPTPYVHLLRNQSIESLFNCAGVLIDDQFVLTSAHCAQQYNSFPKNIYVTQSREIIGIDEVIIHPMFKSGNTTNDFALLKLNKYLNEKLKPACIEKPIPFKSMISLMLYHREASKDQYDIKYVTERFFAGNLPTSEIRLRSYLSVVPTICHLAHGSLMLDVETESIPFLYGVVGLKSTECDQPIYGTLLEKSHLEWIESILIEYQRRQVLVFT